MASAVAGPSGSSTPAAARAFASTDNFISFDFGDDGDGADGSGAASPAAAAAADDADAYAPRAQPQVAGRKRKADERDGRSKKERTRAAARGTPWAVDVEWEECRNAAEMLHRELIAFEQWLSPTREEHESRKLVIELIRRAVVGRWPDATVHSFGSQDTQLYMPQGDIDLVVVCPSMDMSRRETVLRTLAALLRRHNLASDVTVIAKAKVPIIKFECVYGRYRIDVSINQTNGLDAAAWVSDWLRRMPAIRPLILAVKLLLSQRGMSEVFSGGLGSYSVICCVISFVQMHPKLQRGELDPACNLGVLLIEFLELYGKHFGYDRVGISVRGRGAYFDKAARGFADPRKPFALCIEDPMDTSNDISRGSFAIISVRQALGGAFDILTATLCQRANERARGSRAAAALDADEEARQALRDGTSGSAEKDPNSLLGAIFGISRDTIKARRDIEELYYGGMLQHKLGRPPPAASPEPAPAHPSAQQASSSRQAERTHDHRAGGESSRSREQPRAPAATLAAPPRAPGATTAGQSAASGGAPSQASRAQAPPTAAVPAKLAASAASSAAPAAAPVPAIIYKPGTRLPLPRSSSGSAAAAAAASAKPSASRSEAVVVKDDAPERSQSRPKAERASAAAAVAAANGSQGRPFAVDDSDDEEAGLRRDAAKAYWNEDIQDDELDSRYSSPSGGGRRTAKRQKTTHSALAQQQQPQRRSETFYLEESDSDSGASVQAGARKPAAQAAQAAAAARGEAAPKTVKAGKAVVADFWASKSGHVGPADDGESDSA